jgi:hypothetical protein
VYPRPASNSLSSYLNLPSTGITERYTQLPILESIVLANIDKFKCIIHDAFVYFSENILSSDL